jgi:hypothetical protein
MAISSTSVGVGNTLAVKHGAQSEVIVAAELPAAVAALHDALSETLPYLQPADLLLVEQAARLVVRIRLVDEYIDRVGGSLIDTRGRPRGCWKLYASLQHQLRQTLAQLGVGPAIRAEMVGAMASVRSASAAREAQERLRRDHAADVAALERSGEA